MRLEIIRQRDSENPREAKDGFCVMYCSHAKYRLGDLDAKPRPRKGVAAWLPLYLLDRSGLRISTVDFNDRWDSGPVGHVYIMRDRLLKEYGKSKMVHALRECALRIMRSEVAEYDDYLAGNVYGYRLFGRAGEEVDSCWGFYGQDYKKNGMRDHISVQVDSPSALDIVYI